MNHDDLQPDGASMPSPSEADNTANREPPEPTAATPLGDSHADEVQPAEPSSASEAGPADSLAQCPSRTPWTLQLSGRATGCATCGLAKKPAAGGLVRLSGPKPHAFGPRQVANSRSCSVQARLRTVRRCQDGECGRQVQQVDMLGTPSMTLPKSSPLMATPDPISSSLP